MTFVKPKKHLGQHFLNDEYIAVQIVESLTQQVPYKKVLEVGPGMGVLTKHLVKNTSYTTSVVELDRESIAYLKTNFPQLQDRIIEGDFLHIPIVELMGNEPFAIIGNFPYNISTQIMFTVLENRDIIPEVVGMFQKEVAERIASGPGNRDYGILSVLLQAYYDIEYLFTVEPHLFTPPPKVRSGVIRCRRNDTKDLRCGQKRFQQVVKLGFNQRRKTLRNALSSILPPDYATTIPYLTKRAEELSWQQFEELTLSIYKQ